MLESLKVSYYKGFEEASIEFAKPTNNKSGSGLTLIVGPNNTGKTALLESITFKPPFLEKEKHHNLNSKIEIKFEGKDAIVFSSKDSRKEQFGTYKKYEHYLKDAFEIISIDRMELEH